MAQFFVHLPPEPLHVLLAEAEGLPQSQTLAVLQRSRKGQNRSRDDPDGVRVWAEEPSVTRVCSTGETHLQYKRSTVTVVVLAPHVLQHTHDYEDDTQQSIIQMKNQELPF